MFWLAFGIHCRSMMERPEFTWWVASHETVEIARRRRYHSQRMPACTLVYTYIAVTKYAPDFTQLSFKYECHSIRDYQVFFVL